MLDLVIVLPSGSRQPVGLPVDAPSGRVAAKTATTLGVKSEEAGDWVFVRDATGETLDPSQPLSAFGLQPDEAVRLGTLSAAAPPASAPDETAAMPSLTKGPAPADEAATRVMGAATPPGQQPGPYPGAGAAPPAGPAFDGPPPTGAPWSPPAPVHGGPGYQGAPAAHAQGAPWPAGPHGGHGHPSQPAPSRSKGPLLAAVGAGVVALIAIVALVLVLVLGGGDDEEGRVASGGGETVQSEPTPSASEEGSESADPDPAPDSGEEGTFGEDPAPEAGGDAEEGTEDPSQDSGGAGVPELTDGGTYGYTSQLPAGWNAIQLEESQTAPEGITRTRTKLIAPSGGRTLIVDALTGFDKDAETNRRDLADLYRQKEAGYSFIAFDQADLPSATGYLWEYSMPNSSGRMTNRANMLFDYDGQAFAVLASGPSTDSVDELAALAEAVAASIAQ